MFGSFRFAIVALGNNICRDIRQAHNMDIREGRKVENELKAQEKMVEKLMKIELQPVYLDSS